MKTRRVSRRLLAAAIGVLAISHGAATAATIAVNSTADENSASAPNSSCTLREAIIAANTNTALGGCIAGDPGVDTIAVPPGIYLLTIAGASEDLGETGDLDVYENLSILGAGGTSTILSGGGLDRVVHAHPGPAPVSLTLNSLQIEGGVSPDWGGGVLADRAFVQLVKVNVVKCVAPAGGAGAAVFSGGGVYPTLSLNDVSLNSNQSYGGLWVGLYASAVVEDSQIHKNADIGVLSYGNTVIRRSTVTANGTGSGGGGIAVTDGTTIVEDSTLESNVGVGIGAGCGPGACTSTLFVRRSTIDANSTWGLAAVTSPYGGSSAVQVENSTVSGNGSDGVLNNAMMGLKHVTVSKNAGAQIRTIYYLSSAPLTVVNSVVNGSCSIDPLSTFASSGGNVESPSNTCLFTHASDLANVPDLKLLALAANGGPTWTHELAVGSPAIGRGLATHCLPTDQRGAARPAPTGGNCDSGAYERTGCGASLAGLLPPTLMIPWSRRRRIRIPRPSA